MKKLIVGALLLLLSLVALVALGGAEVKEEDIRVNHLFVNEEKVAISDNSYIRDVIAGFDLSNLANENLEDVTLTVVIPELGIKRSVGPFDVKKDEDTTKKVLIELLDDAPPGEYDIRFTLSSENFRKVRHRTVSFS
jgi:uncharacterized membrane protein